MILLFQCLLTFASAADLILDLNDKVDKNLLACTEYHLDKKGTSTINSIQDLPNTAWNHFNREQLRFGFTSNRVWLRTTFHTTGRQSKEVVFALHKAIDNITMHISKDGGSSQLYTFTKHIDTTEQSANNLNNARVFLEPGHHYQLLLQINSTSPVIGEFKMIEADALEKMATQVNQWVIIAILLIILVSVYNVVAFASSRHPAIIAHLIYVLSVLGYLLNDFSYIQKLTGSLEPGIVQRISAIFLIISILSLTAFFRSLSTQTPYSAVFEQCYRCLFLVGYVLVPVMFFMHIQYVHLLMFVLLGLSIMVGVAHAFVTWREASQDNDDDNALSLTMIIVLATLVPSVMIHILSRRGIIDVIWYTEFVLFASVILEVILISIVLFFNVRKSKAAYHREMHTNSLSDLPNDRALEAFFDQQSLPENKTLIQVWISGLDELQIAFGPQVYKEFLMDTASQMSLVLNDTPAVIKWDHHTLGPLPLFHSDKNTFTLLCTQLDKSSRNIIQERLTNTLDTMSHLHRNSIDLKIVLGAYEFNHRTTALNSALVNCNLALAYSIKHNRKFKFYTPQMSFDERQRLRLVNDFHQSLAKKEFFLLWQPQYDTQTSTIIGAEVLSRWQHEQYGLISPELFIPLLEQSNRICELSRWVINEVLKQLPALHQRHPEIEISINLSPRDLIGDDLVDFLDSKLMSHAPLIPFITFEITETLLIDDYSQVLKNIGKLQLRGFKISIDDFGSGYTSFTYLQKLPANELKIDKIYTDSYQETSSNAILESMIFMAKRLNMRVVVEGIEHPQQVDLFKRLGAERLQGWMLDKPMSINSLLDKDTSLA
ncbi:MAG: EAL domain-containing protein [Leucothrix sp.]